MFRSQSLSHSGQSHWGPNWMAWTIGVWFSWRTFPSIWQSLNYKRIRGKWSNDGSIWRWSLDTLLVSCSQHHHQHKKCLLVILLFCANTHKQARHKLTILYIHVSRQQLTMHVSLHLTKEWHNMTWLDCMATHSHAKTQQKTGAPAVQAECLEDQAGKGQGARFANGPPFLVLSHHPGRPPYLSPHPGNQPPYLASTSPLATFLVAMTNTKHQTSAPTAWRWTTPDHL